jgi:hypothetical protein
MQICYTCDISIEKEVQGEDHKEREETRCEIVLAWFYSLEVVVDERLVLIGSEIQVVLSVRHIHGEKPLEKRFKSNKGFEDCDFTFSC